ncbi:MAG TPA: glycerol-3-phosphate dehydrogenase C-terminal domain-containing protein, partial [Longimicrobiaceae bacterium]|nr:glycerol-3-phosphate dehydrogenase C-terminal domain-containing protein [Longimicrobiaceae bacterium]
VHVVLRREHVGNVGALIFPSPVDGRIMFVLPWEPFTYVGTTDTDFRGSPWEAGADADDVDYLLASVNGLFPDARLTRADVLSTWTGVRPLLAPRTTGDGITASATSREHEIWRDRGGLVNVAGGKLTTYRVMAAQTVDFVGRVTGRERELSAFRGFTEDLPLAGAPGEEWPAFLERIRAAAAEVGIPEATAVHLARAYGEDAEEVFAVVGKTPESGAPLVRGLPYLWAEVEHAVACEMAMTLEDVLRRRLHLFHQAEDGGVSVARMVAERMAALPGIGWGEAEITGQVERYRAAVEATR